MEGDILMQRQGLEIQRPNYVSAVSLVVIDPASVSLKLETLLTTRAKLPHNVWYLSLCWPNRPVSLSWAQSRLSCEAPLIGITPGEHSYGEEVIKIHYSEDGEECRLLDT